MNDTILDGERCRIVADIANLWSRLTTSESRAEGKEMTDTILEGEQELPNEPGWWVEAGSPDRVQHVFWTANSTGSTDLITRGGSLPSSGRWKLLELPVFEEISEISAFKKLAEFRRAVFMCGESAVLSYIESLDDDDRADFFNTVRMLFCVFCGCEHPAGGYCECWVNHRPMEQGVVKE